jgi:hypothetical protein
MATDTGSALPLRKMGLPGLPVILIAVTVGFVSSAYFNELGCLSSTSVHTLSRSRCDR